MARLDIDKLLRKFPKVKFKKGDIILHSGQISGRGYVVTSGIVKVYSFDPDRIERRIISTQAYELMPSGWLSNQKEVLRYNYAAYTDVTCAVISETDFNKAALDNPKALYSLLKIQDERVQYAKYRIETLVQSRAEDKILFLFYYMAHRVADDANMPGRINITALLSKQEIGDSLGLSRETTTKALATLTQRGILGADGYKKYWVCTKKMNEAISEAAGVID